MNLVRQDRFRDDIRGFTLVELVVVVAIIAILAVLLVPRISQHVLDARTTREIYDARMLAGEIITYNTIAKLNGTATIPNPLPASGTLELTKPMLGSTSLELTDDDKFPDNTIVKIMIDSTGNAIIVQ